MPKREVKEEEEIQVPRHRLHSGAGITIRELKVEVKEEEKERDKVAALLREQRLNATSDTPGFNAAFMASLNARTAWMMPSPSPSARAVGRSST
jgi:hypothetical protein